MAKGPSLIPGLFYEDPDAAVEWLAKAFGFELRMSYTDDVGRIAYAEVELGEGVVALRPQRGHSPQDLSPRVAGGVNTAHLAVAVPDVDAHCARAQQAGARVLEPLEDKFYGLRTYAVEDCEGHRWTFESALAGPAPNDERWKRSEGRPR
jgi:uncharacterized glyoxalase superfamily protein PhnB